ncbi:hypothetical protein N657DRAFT_684253 [Parathielavia appendiculata]|uniref:Uncharacterized protein n=1 Tax=Parathielavia appendiculata TaxID=2587402 RepID=A0AAN6TRX8_9PEZI|nr:hypothetical protein N657DRAFT_684253 [Parathielavia appendiculata]
MHILVTLPHRLNPSLPAPPQQVSTVPPYDSRDHHALPVFRHLMTQVLPQLLGSSSSNSDKHAAAVPDLQFEVTTDSTEVSSIACYLGRRWVSDKAKGFDLETGDWRG